jgi:hypothetical protein
MISRLAYLIGQNRHARYQDQRSLETEESLKRCEDCHPQSGCRCQQHDKEGVETTDHTTRSAHAQAAQHQSCGFSEALPKSCKCSSLQHHTARFGKAQTGCGQVQVGGNNGWAVVRRVEK